MPGMSDSQHALTGSFPEDVVAIMASGSWSIESIITREFSWEQLPQAIEQASRVDEALNVTIRY